MRNKNNFLRYFYSIENRYLFLKYYDHKNILNYNKTPGLKFLELGLNLKLDWGSEIRNDKLKFIIFKILGIIDEL